MKVFIIILFSVISFSTLAQVRPSKEVETENSSRKNEIKERFNNIPPKEEAAPKSQRSKANSKPSSKSKQSASKRGSNTRKKGGKGLVIQKNTRDKDKMKKFTLAQGEKVVVKTKDGEKYKGAIANVKAPKFTVGDSLVELNKIEMVKRGFFPILKKRSSGLGLFIGGTIVTAAGTFIGYASTLVFQQGGPFIIVTAMGITTAIGINIVGVSIAAEGAKLMAERVKWKIGDKWKVSLN